MREVWELEFHERNGSITIKQSNGRTVGQRGIVRHEIVEIHIEEKEVERVTLKEMLNLMRGKCF